MTNLISVILPHIENELKKQVSRLEEKHTQVFFDILKYHMGWEEAGSGQQETGKRIRPLLVLLTVASNDADWIHATPAAVAIELIHNFSLIHDDIQDNSEIRRGRITVWKKWGAAQAINAGDGLFALAQLATTDLRENYPVDIVLRVSRILQEACLDLTRGQYLDMSYETNPDLKLEDYWIMISKKTAALLASCTHIGAILGGVPEDNISPYIDFGHYLGLAYQVKDDFLGIWGDSAIMGKSNASDLITRKKSLPVIYGLEKRGPFYARWNSGAIHSEDVKSMADMLTEEGAQIYTIQLSDQLTDMAMNALRIANPQGEAGQLLFELAHRLLGRVT